MFKDLPSLPLIIQNDKLLIVRQLFDINVGFDDERRRSIHFGVAGFPWCQVVFKNVRFVQLDVELSKSNVLAEGMNVGRAEDDQCIETEN